jgi:hypothetical protein
MTRATLAAALVLLTAPAAAQRPWEQRLDLPLVVPVELPALPPVNPFITPGATTPAPAATPLLAKLETTWHVEAAVYVDAKGVSRRAVLLAVPLSDVAEELSSTLLESSFQPALAQGRAVPAWISVSFDLTGRIKEGRAADLVPGSPEPAAPAAVETPAVPSAAAADLDLPATPAAELDRAPAIKKLRVSLRGRAVRHHVRLLAEVTPEGRCSRVVFLACPPGFHDWLLRSLSSWTFHPPTAGGAPTTAWVGLDAEVEAELSGFAADRLAISRTVAYPPAAAAPAGAPPRGE